MVDGGKAVKWLYKEHKETRNCLSFDRESHRFPLFVELKCNLPRHFVCEKDMSKEAPGPVDLGNDREVSVLGNIKYILYRFRTNFHTAVTICSNFHDSLAIVKTFEIGTFLHRAMYKSRPDKSICLFCRLC